MSLDKGLDYLLLGNYDEALKCFNSTKSPGANKLRLLAAQLADVKHYAADMIEDVEVAQPATLAHHADHLVSIHKVLHKYKNTIQSLSGNQSSPACDSSMTLEQCDLIDRVSRYENNYDQETGLLNRKAFARAIFDKIKANPCDYGVLIACHIDNIKYVNETYGYEQGDYYLNSVIESLQHHCGASTIVSRLGGNEFAIYAHRFGSEEEALSFTNEKIRKIFHTKVALPKEVVRIRTSCGLALYPTDATTSDLLVTYAAYAMFEAVKINKGSSVRYTQEIYRSKANLLNRQERLNELIENKLIHFVFQPIVDLHAGSFFGYEALMRPDTDIFSSPLDILSIAEAQSKLDQLERATFEMIFDWVHRHIPTLNGKKIFFNITSAHYLDTIELNKINPNYQLITEHMVFEILETAMTENILTQKVNTIRNELAALIAIDDFGSGHSNALRLINIKPDILKVDRLFISGIDSAQPAKKALLSNILDYCRANKIRTLAEGVETSKELATIIEMKFDYAQGFYLARPDAALTNISPKIKQEILALHK